MDVRAEIVAERRDLAALLAGLSAEQWSTPSLCAGWTVHEATLVMGLFMVMQAVAHGVIEPNLGAVVEGVRDGNFDLVLMKPVDAQLLVSLRKFTPSALWDLIAGGVLAGLALTALGPPSLLDVLLAIGLFATGTVAMYGLWLLAICASFVFVRVDNLRFLLWSATDAGRWPIDVFGGWVRLLLTAVVPVALITSFPAEALRGSWSVDTLVQASAVTVLFVVGSRWMWMRSLARYTSASS